MNKRVLIYMSVLSFFYHLFIFLIGILLSIPSALLFIYIFTSNTSNEHIHHVKSLLFPSKQQSKSDILTISTNEIPFRTVWMFAVIVTDIKLSNRIKLQPIYLKLYHQYLFIHLTSKRIKNINQINRHKIFFSEVIIFDLSQAEINLRLNQQVRTQYWSHKTPIVLSQLQFLVRYRIDKKKKNQQQDEDKTLVDRLQGLVFKWLTNKDEIYLYTLTMRSKEEWFYRLHNSIKLHSKSLIEQQSTINSTEYQSTKSSLSPTNIPLDQIELEYTPQKQSLNILTNKSSSTPIDNHSSSFKINDSPNASSNHTWRMLIKTFFEHIHLFQSENLNNDYLDLINNIISRCTIDVYKNLNLRNYFKEKIQHELKHFKLPYYIHWIRISYFHFDNIYPTIENFKKLWFNHNGLWTAVDFTYQGNISIEFTIKINLIRSSRLKRLFYFRENIQVLRKIINTILTITINIRSIKGVLLINIPLPPSDRIWFGFEDMPLIDFDVHHRQLPQNKSQSSIDTQNYSNKELNQLETTINHLLSQWIKKQIHKECVLPNMHDICMKWCNNPFEKDDLLTLLKSRINHLLWLNQTDFENKFEKYFIPYHRRKKIYLIAQWKQNHSFNKLHKKCRKQKLLLPKRIFLRDTFLIFEHR